MPHASAKQLVGLLAEPDRLRVVAALVLGATRLDDIARTSGLDVREATKALGRLEAAGLVEQSADGSTWVLLAEAFKQAALAEADAPVDAFPDATSEEGRVLNQAFVDGRLVALPTKRAKRLVVLNHLAQLFEPGEHYGERRVNAILAVVNDDTAMLRRWLVDEGFLDRADGEYWRSGGSVT